MHTELGRSQVVVQRCSLSSGGPRLRSSGAHCVRKLAKSLAKSWQGESEHGSGGRGGGKAELSSTPLPPKPWNGNIMYVGDMMHSVHIGSMLEWRFRAGDHTIGGVGTRDTETCMYILYNYSIYIYILCI